ncbi:MAG: tetratricopeptide repeat protein, partial [Armatimonadota bacterium]
GQRTEAFRHVLAGNRIEQSLPGLGHWLMSVWGAGATWGPVIALWAGTTIIAVLSLWMASRERPSTADIWLAGVNLLLVVGIFSPPAAERFGSFGPSGWTEAGMMYVWAAGVFVPVMIIDAVWDLIRGSPRGKESLLAGFSWTWAVVMFIEWLMTADTPYRPSLVPIIAIPIGLSVLLTRGQIIAHFATLIHRPARRHEKTIAWLRAAMRIDKSRQCRALAQVGIGDAYTQLGQYDEALRANEQALALDLRPTSGTAAANMSFLYTAMGRFEDATTMWQRAKQLCGSVSHAAIPDVCQAMLLVRQGQYEAGIAVARAALGKSLTPAQIKAAANAILGYGLAMMGDFQGATAACESACKTKQAKPWASIAETAMGIMWSTSGHWQEAAQHFAKAVELVEVGPEASLRAAQAYAMLGEWEKAEASLKAARDDAPLSQLAPIAADLLEHGRAAWHRTVLPMPRAPVYSQPPQGYSPPGHPHGQPPTY